MPTPSNELGAAQAAFEKARSALSAAQVAISESRTASNLAALSKAQEAFKEAGQEVRRAKNPERAHDVLEYRRYLAEKAKLVRARSQRQVMS